MWQRCDWIDQQKQNMDNIVADDVTDLKLEMFFQCNRSPMRSSKKNNYYILCEHHYDMAIKKYKIRKTNINKFVQWFRVRYKIDKIHESMKKPEEEGNSTMKLEERIRKLEKLLVKLNKTDVKRWKIVRNASTIDKITSEFYFKKCPSIAKKSFLRTRTSTNANDYKAIYNKILTDERDLLHKEITDDTEIRKTKGCRKPANLNTAATCQTCGINGWFTCSGFCINLREETYRETDTSVLFETADIFMANSTHHKYAERCEAIGYDMMCRIFNRFYTLAKEKRLTGKRFSFWFNLIRRAFVDGFHISTHKTDECKLVNGSGMFHPKLTKFDNIFGNKVKVDMNKKVNAQIAEQFWSMAEKATYVRAMCKPKFHFHLFQVRQYHNCERKLTLETDGWLFVPIEYVSTLQTIDDTIRSLPSKKNLIKQCASIKKLQCQQLSSQAQERVMDLLI